MIFVKHFDSTLKEAMEEIKHFVECGADVAITVGKNGVLTATCDVVKPNAFLHCIKDHVDEHTLAAWEHDLELYSDYERR